MRYITRWAHSALRQTQTSVGAGFKPARPGRIGARGARTDPREEEDSVANQVGKRYQCTKCGTEMIVTKGGDGAIGCCGEPMQQKQ